MTSKRKTQAAARRHVGLRALSLAAAVALTACGGGDDDPVFTGTYVDSPVSGLNYVGTSTPAGVTDANGQFTYRAGERITFSIGNLALGSGDGASVVTPLSTTSGASTASDLRVNNKLILLQTLDADGDLNNGIQITDAIRAEVSARAASINFDQPTAAFRTSLTPLLNALNAANVFTDLDPRARSARAATAALEHFARSTSPRHVVTTNLGQLSGYEVNANTWQYLGVPYARPPVGDLRWRPPVAAQPWNGVRQAVGWSDQAAQDFRMESNGEGGMSEDSLYLNITAPKNASNLPVMVWFHGGSFAILTGNSKLYNNPAITGKDVVLVTVNHRLGIFGYLAHPLLSAESGYNGSGNYGQMDLVMALQWVKDNIAQFGGNPANVTIFGQSGGGGKTFALMNSPMAQGLFHKAIVQSGASPTTPLTNNTETGRQTARATSLNTGHAIGTAVFNRVGATTLAQARALPWTAFVQADLDNNIPRETYRPNVDYRFLPKTYGENLVDGLPNQVPMMVGVTNGDYSTLRSALPPFLAQFAPAYAPNKFVYKFSRVPAGWDALGLRACHGCELPYLFNYPMGLVSNFALGLVTLNDGVTRPTIGDLNGNGTTGSAGDLADVYASMQWGANDVTTADTTMTMWTNFAKTGNPSLTGQVWTPYSTANDTYLEVNQDTSTSIRTGVTAAMQ
jgi:para-nitrobenzyl esterase